MKSQIIYVKNSNTENEKSASRNDKRSIDCSPLKYQKIPDYGDINFPVSCNTFQITKSFILSTVKKLKQTLSMIPLSNEIEKPIPIVGKSTSNTSAGINNNHGLNTISLSEAFFQTKDTINELLKPEFLSKLKLVSICTLCFF